MKVRVKLHENEFYIARDERDITVEAIITQLNATGQLDGKSVHLVECIAKMMHDSITEYVRQEGFPVVINEQDMFDAMTKIQKDLTLV